MTTNNASFCKIARTPFSQCVCLLRHITTIRCSPRLAKDYFGHQMVASLLSILDSPFDQKRCSVFPGQSVVGPHRQLTDHLICVAVDHVSCVFVRLEYAENVPLANSDICCSPALASPLPQRRQRLAPVAAAAAVVVAVAFVAVVWPVPSFARRVLGFEGGTSALWQDNCT